MTDTVLDKMPRVKLFKKFAALWEERGMSRHRAHLLFKEATGRSSVPHFLSLTDEEVAEIDAALDFKNLDKIIRATGRTTGVCQCCGRELTDPQSIEQGIGPICAQNFNAAVELEDLL